MFDEVVEVVVGKRKKERGEAALCTVDDADNDGGDVLLPARAQTLGPITVLPRWRRRRFPSPHKASPSSSLSPSVRLFLTSD
jgi:hypothetical protein